MQRTAYMRLFFRTSWESWLRLIVLALTPNVQRRTVHEGVFLGHPTREIRGSGLENNALFLVVGEGADGEFVMFPGRRGLAPGRLRHFGQVAAHLGKLFSEGPIPAGPGDLFP